MGKLIEKQTILRLFGEMLSKPAACKPCNVFERTRLFKQMGGSGDNVDPMFSVQ